MITLRPIGLGIFVCLLMVAGVVCANKFAAAHLELSGPIVAAGAAIVASVLAAMTLQLARRASLPTVMQVSLLATLVHMSLLLIFAAVIFVKDLPVGPSFLYWLLAMYLVTIVALVASIAATIRAASPTVTATKA